LSKTTRNLLEQAWNEVDWIRRASAQELFSLACQQLSLDPKLHSPFPRDMSAVTLGDLRHVDLVAELSLLFPAGTDLASALADQIQIARAFADPASVIEWITTLVGSVVEKFPRLANDLKIGQNQGDVLDPFMLSANFELLSSQDLAHTIDTATSHKVLMKIEDLLGNLHQGVIGRMRGNIRIPEPQGDAGGKEILHPTLNPFPGADIAQVPVPGKPMAIRLFQIKSKTGSATGSYGKRLGEQLRRLHEVYGADTFYAAVVGNTLLGHRSKGAVLRESPTTAVVVGQAALSEATQCAVGGELLLRVYQRSFRAAAESQGYDFRSVVVDIAEEFQREADDDGADFLTSWLHKAIGGPPQLQDSRLASSRALRRATR